MDNLTQEQLQMMLNMADAIIALMGEGIAPKTIQEGVNRAYAEGMLVGLSYQNEVAPEVYNDLPAWMTDSAPGGSTKVMRFPSDGDLPDMSFWDDLKIPPLDEA